MERIPEPAELMNDPEQARAYALADFEEPHEQFVSEFKRRFEDLPTPGRALDLGCGAADVTIRFARAFPACRLDGVDGAPAMLSHGRRAVIEAGLQGRITLIEGRLPDARLSRERYDCVISNSLLHHLADPQALWHTVREHGKRDAAVFVMDLMRPASPAALQSLVARHAGDESEMLRRDFLNSLMAAYRPDEVGRQLNDAGLGTLRVEAASDRHLVVWGRLR